MPSAFKSISRALMLTLLALLRIPASAEDASDTSKVTGKPVSNEQRAALAAATLQSWYNPDTGLYRTTGWWNSANAITALADYSRLAHSKQYRPVFSNAFTAAQKTGPGFLNNFYDDEGWWALAWIDVYGITRDARYLAMAESIFKDMSGGWDNTCSGGIWWSKDRKYKNAIANELFLDVAAQLALHAKKSGERVAYRDWAEKELNWFAHSGMINSDHLVNDGLDESCANNHKTTWSYNQGVIVGGLARLSISSKVSSKAASDPALLAQADEIAKAAISHITDPQGILHDPCEPKCGADGTQFKGIFARNLRILNETQPSQSYEHFLLTNADSVWSQATPGNSHLGPVWTSPFGDADASTQSSALDLLVAAAATSKAAK